jgi:thioredoxin 1
MPVKPIASQDWDEIADSETPVLVNFSAERCGFCKALDPLYSRLADAYEGRMTFAKAMVDKEPDLASKAGIEGTPTLKFYCKGREVGEHVGYAIEPVLRKKIDDMLAEMEACYSNSTPLKATKAAA